MKNENKTFFIIVGAVLLGIFIAIGLLNLAGVGEYQLSTDVVKHIEYKDGKLIVTTRNDMVSVCIKQTKSEPTINSLCWADTINSKASISVYEYKTYYIWTKDANDVISYYNKYNVHNK